MESEHKNHDEKVTELLASHRKDKQREAKLYIWIGIIFLVWTAFDVASGFFEDMWYVNIFFGGLGLAMLAFGLIQARAYRHEAEKKE